MQWSDRDRTLAPCSQVLVCGCLHCRNNIISACHSFSSICSCERACCLQRVKCKLTASAVQCQGSRTWGTAACLKELHSKASLQATRQASVFSKACLGRVSVHACSDLPMYCPGLFSEPSTRLKLNDHFETSCTMIHGQCLSGQWPMTQWTMDNNDCEKQWPIQWPIQWPQPWLLAGIQTGLVLITVSR